SRMGSDRHQRDRLARMLSAEAARHRTLRGTDGPAQNRMNGSRREPARLRTPPASTAAAPSIAARTWRRNRFTATGTTWVASEAFLGQFGVKVLSHQMRIQQVADRLIP